MDKNDIIIGVDFGGVFSVLDGSRNAEHKETTINIPNVIETITKIVNIKDTKYNYIFYIISYCGYKRAIETFNALRPHLHLFEKCYFVKDRMYKSELCKYLGCHIMIDDRKDILDNIIKTNSYITTILFNNYKCYYHKSIDNWNDIYNYVIKYIPKEIKPDKKIDINNLIHDI
jgi:hypothetical protein